MLRAIGVEEENAHTSIRFGIGRFSTVAEVDHTIALTVRNVKRLREMSPLWEMVQDGACRAERRAAALPLPTARTHRVPSPPSAGIDLKSIEWTEHH